MLDPVLFDAYGLQVQIPAALRGASKFNKRLQFRLKVLYPDGFCSYCGSPAQSRDHVVPRAKGGLNDIRNYVPACRSCNQSKADKPLLIFLLQRAG